MRLPSERVLAPSCCRGAAAGMVVQTASPRAVAARKTVLELLLADMPAEKRRQESELDRWAGSVGLARARGADLICP